MDVLTASYDPRPYGLVRGTITLYDDGVKDFVLNIECIYTDVINFGSEVLKIATSTNKKYKWEKVEVNIERRVVIIQNQKKGQKIKEA